MKHKNSIVICEFDDGTLDLFVNGAHVLRDGDIKTPLNRIANSTLTTEQLQSILYRVHETPPNPGERRE